MSELHPEAIEMSGGGLSLHPDLWWGSYLWVQEGVNVAPQLPSREGLCAVGREGGCVGRQLSASASEDMPKFS